MSQAEKFRRIPEVKLKPVGRSVAAFVGEHRALHVLNDTARLILEYLEEPADAEELVLMLRESTDGDEARIRSDLDESLASFLDLHLIETVP